MSEYDDFVASLEALGEPEVKSKFSQGVWASKRKQWVECCRRPKIDPLIEVMPIQN